MGSISDYLENELADHVLNSLTYTPAVTVYLALFQSSPGDDGGGTETSYTGYARQAITFGAAASRRVTQSGAVTFGMNTGSSVTITHWGIKDAASSGNLLAHGSFASSVIVATNNTPAVANGGVYIEFSAGKISNYLANKLLDLAFRNQSYSPPRTYVAFTTATIGDSDTGSTIVEPTSGGYRREEIYINGGWSPTWSLAENGLAGNLHAVTMVAPKGAWGTLTSAAIVDAVAGGNLLFYDNGITDQAIVYGDIVEFIAGNLVVSFS